MLYIEYGAKNVMVFAPCHWLEVESTLHKGTNLQIIYE